MKTILPSLLSPLILKNIMEIKKRGHFMDEMFFLFRTLKHFLLVFNLKNVDKRETIKMRKYKKANLNC